MNTRRLTWFIGWGLTILVAVMPFHAFLSVWFGSIVGHQAIIQAWKEVLLALLGLAGLWLVAVDRSTRDRLKNPLALAVLALVLVAIVVTVFEQPTLTAIAFGAKTDLEFLLAFILAWLVGGHLLMRRLILVILAGAGVVIAFGLLQTFVLPADFLSHFGYNSTTILPFQRLTTGFTGLRFSSTLGGANQLATYLILPLCLALALRRRSRPLLLMIPLGLIVLFSTYSRSGWIGAIVALGITLYLSADTIWRRRLLIGLAAGAVLVVITFSLSVSRTGDLQYLLFHSSTATHDIVGSDVQHGQSILNGASDIAKYPLGHGLGTAGPATFHAGTTNIIENYYLQLGYELGVLGAIIFVTIIMLLILRLITIGGPAAIAVAASIIGISITALVLPAWTDSSTSLILWTLAGVVLGWAAEVEGV